MGKNGIKLAGKLKRARALRMAEEEARVKGKEQLDLADKYAGERVEIMKAIRRSVIAGISTGVLDTDDDIRYLNDELEPPPPEAHQQLPKELFRQAQ